MTALRILAVVAVVVVVAAIASQRVGGAATVSRAVSSSALAGLDSLFGPGETDDEADEDDPGDGPAPRPAAAPPPAFPVATAVISGTIGKTACQFMRAGARTAVRRVPRPLGRERAKRAWRRSSSQGAILDTDE